MEQLISTLPSILRATSNSPEVAQAACIAAWNHAVGESLRNNAVALELQGNILIVAVADGIWQKQLQSMVGQFRYRVNSILGQELVREIELRVEPSRFEF
jgi:hypothetical protein